MFKRTVLILATAAFASAAMAADLNAQTLPPVITKAPAAVAAPVTCTYTSCTGLFAGATMTQINSQGVSIFNLGAVNNSGLYMGARGGYQYLNNGFLIAVKGQVEYEVSTGVNDPLAGSAFKDKLFAFEGIELGGQLAGLFPNVTSSLALPAWMTPLVTGINLGGCQHGSKLSGFCSGVSVHYYLPATQWSFNGDIFNAQYGSTNVGSGITTSTETRSTIGITYHFGPKL